MSSAVPTSPRSDSVPVRTNTPRFKTCHVETLPGGSLVSVDTTDFEEFCEFTAGWKLDHQLSGRTKPHITMAAISTPLFQLGVVKQAGGYCSQGTNPKGTISLAVPLDEARPMIHCGRSIDSPQMVVTRSGNEFELINRFGAHHLVASFSESRLEQYVADFCHEPRHRRHLTGRFQFPDVAHRQKFVESCDAVLRDVRNQPKLLSDSRCSSVLEDRLLENFLLQGHIDSRHSSDGSRYQVARRAYRFLLEAIDEVPSIRKICVMTGASYATLERGYREIYGMAPQVHIKALRLSRARKELRQPRPNTSVTDVAVRWGFFELGRFAVQYRQRFGETPSNTLRKARGTRD